MSYLPRLSVNLEDSMLVDAKNVALHFVPWNDSHNFRFFRNLHTLNWLELAAV